MNQVDIFSRNMFCFIPYFHLGYASGGVKGEPGPSGRDGKNIQKQKNLLI